MKTRNVHSWYYGQNIWPNVATNTKHIPPDPRFNLQFFKLDWITCSFFDTHFYCQNYFCFVYPYFFLIRTNYNNRIWSKYTRHVNLSPMFLLHTHLALVPINQNYHFYHFFSSRFFSCRKVVLWHAYGLIGT